MLRPGFGDRTRRQGYSEGMARRARESDLDPVHVGNEEHDDEAVAVMRGQLHAAFVPVSIGRLDDDQVSLLGALQHIVLEIADRHDQLERLVAEARGEGISWSAIGWSIGTTGEGARKRYADVE